jgi:hypothetical protein
MLCIMVGSVLAAFLVPLAARAWLAAPRPVETPVRAAVWEDRLKVSNNLTNTDGMRFYPAVAAQGENVYVTWSKLMISGTTIYDPNYNWSDSYGDPLNGWGNDDIRIQPNTYKTVNVDMAVDSAGRLHFVWAEETDSPTHTLYYSYSNASAIQPILQYGDAMVPAVAVSNDRVHVVWSQGSADIIYINKTIGPGDWSSSPTTTVRTSPNPVANPTIAVSSNGRVHVAWNEGGGIEAEILYKNSDNWSGSPITVSHNVTTLGSYGPALTVSGNDNVYAVWCEWQERATQYVRFGQSADGGSTWGNSQRISGGTLAANTSAPSYLRPDVAVDSSGRLHVVFNGSTGGISGYEDIFYVSSSNGTSWSSRQDISEANYNATTPAIAVSGDWVHAIWAEKWTTGEYEVIYRRRSTQAGGVYLPIIMKLSLR